MSVAGNLGGEPSGTATLGLIASKFVRVYHPVGETYPAKSGGFGGSCNNGDTYNSTTKLCEYQNTGKTCDAPNLNASEDTTNGWGTQENIWIYAVILSTKHSFAVDNYKCGAELGELNVYGAIAQNFRGIVGTGSGPGMTGYIKNYNYDQRLAADEPPYFLAAAEHRLGSQPRDGRRRRLAALRRRSRARAAGATSRPVHARARRARRARAASSRRRSRDLVASSRENSARGCARPSH